MGYLQADRAAYLAGRVRVRWRKLAGYLAAGVVVWVVNPHDRQVEVYVPGEAVRLLDERSTLEGGSVLPGFTLAVKDILPQSVSSPAEATNEDIGVDNPPTASS